MWAILIQKLHWCVNIINKKKIHWCVIIINKKKHCYSYRCWRYLNSTSESYHMKYCMYAEHSKQKSCWYHALCIWLQSSLPVVLLIKSFIPTWILLCQFQFDFLQVLVQHRTRDHLKWHQENIWTSRDHLKWHQENIWTSRDHLKWHQKNIWSSRDHLKWHQENIWTSLYLVLTDW